MSWTSPFDRPSALRDEQLHIFEQAVTKFFSIHAPPHDVARWRAQGMVDRTLWEEAGRAGLLCASIPQCHGGSGGDFRHEAVILEAVVRQSADGFGIALHNNMVAPYILHHGTDQQKKRWLPRMASGEFIGAIAMTEPGTGSDLRSIRTTARRNDGGYILNGAKTFISNGQLANLVCVAAKTDPDLASTAISLFIVETEGAAGFRRGRRLDKVGNDAQDTSELFFDQVYVPEDSLLGLREGEGFGQLMAELPRERLVIAAQGVAMMEQAIVETLRYVKEREAFGRAIFDFQNTQFKLAEAATDTALARQLVDRGIELLLEDRLDPVAAAMTKYWVTERQWDLIDSCVQLFGGNGYMNEYPIARMWRDARVQRVYGGSNEVMKTIIARAL